MNFVRLWLRRLPIDYIIFLLLEMNRILGYKALIITKTKKTKIYKRKWKHSKQMEVKGKSMF